MKFSYKEIIWTVISIVIAAFLITGSTYALIHFAGSGADWVSAVISFNGNIIGGIIGGIVAIIVAKYQIYRSKLQEENKQTETTKTMLKLIREELRDNISALSNMIPYDPSNFPLLKSSLSDDTWKSTMLHLSISDELLVKIHVCYKKITLLKNLSSDEVDETLISSCKNTLEQTLDNIKAFLNETGN